MEILRYKNFLDYLIKGDKRGCHQFVADYLKESGDVKALYLYIFQPALYDVGHLWEHNKISIAREHIATSIVESLMQLSYPYIFENKKNGKKVIIACVAEEHHQIGARMIADLFDLAGWSSSFVGANTPVDVITGLIQDEGPDLLGLSLSIYFNADSLRETLNAVQEKFPELPVIIGGQGVSSLGMEFMKRFPKYEIIQHIEALDEITSLKKIMGKAS